MRSSSLAVQQWARHLLGHILAARQAITRLSWAPSLAGAHAGAQLAPDPRLSRPVVMGPCRSVIVTYSTSRDEVMAVVTPASRWRSAASSPASTLS
jgi:hypothetical protein